MSTYSTAFRLSVKVFSAIHFDRYYPEDVVDILKDSFDIRVYCLSECLRWLQMNCQEGDSISFPDFTVTLIRC